MRHLLVVYKRFLTIRGLPDINETPQLMNGIDRHNRERGILPIAGFEYDFRYRKFSEPIRAVRPTGERDVFFIAGTYRCGPGSHEPTYFYPAIVRTKGNLRNGSEWEPLFIEAHQVQQWLDPWFACNIRLEGQPFGYFDIKDVAQVA